METSLRYGGDSKTIRIHAKEKYPIDSITHLQLHGELDTRLGAPTQLGVMIRHFYPDVFGSLGVGLLYHRKEKIRYNVRAKLRYPVTKDEKINFHVKGRCDVDQEFKQKRYGATAEFTLIVPDFKKDQDVRLKVGYEIFDKVIYFMGKASSFLI